MCERRWCTPGASSLKIGMPAAHTMHALSLSECSRSQEEAERETARERREDRERGERIG